MVTKNCEPLVFGPQFAEESKPASTSGQLIEHRRGSRLTIMLLPKLLVVKLGPVDRLTPGTVSSLKVAPLDHETGNDSVKLCPLVAKVLGQRLAAGFLARAESSKVGSGLPYEPGPSSRPPH
jgi:hypothetical protein